MLIMILTGKDGISGLTKIKQSLHEQKLVYAQI